MSAIYTLSTRCCCDLAPTGCPCDEVYDGWQSGYFDLPARIKMTFDYYTPQCDRKTLVCGMSTTCYQGGQWYECEETGATSKQIGYGETPYGWQGLRSGDACSFAGCREYNSEGDCSVGCSWGHESHAGVSYYDFCSRTCDSHCNDYARVFFGVGDYMTTADADNETPMEAFLEAGEVYFERVVWSFGGEARIAYVFDSTHYEPGDPINDSVEWGEEPILQTIPNEPVPHYARALWTVANMFNSKTSNRCTYPGIADGAGDGGPLGDPPPTCPAAPSPQYISSQHFRMYISLMKTDDDPVCRWRLVTFFQDDMNGNSICSPGPNDCGSMPDTNDADECECWGSECDASDASCYNSEYGICCNGNVGGDPCDSCGRPSGGNAAYVDTYDNGNCCGCQAADSGKSCVRWAGDDGLCSVLGWDLNGLGGCGTPLFLFNGVYTPTDNIECYANPFDPDRFHLWGGDGGEPDGPNVRWGWGDNPNAPIPNVPLLNLDWADIVTPLDLARHRWENGSQWNLHYGDITKAYGFIRVTGFEVTEE